MDLWRILEVGGRRLRYVSLAAADEAASGAISRLPVSLKVLLENVLRRSQAAAGGLPREAKALAGQVPLGDGGEISFYPSRVLMPDSSGLPLIADLAAMRDAAVASGIPAKRINPVVPVDLVVDHSLIVDVAGEPDAQERNLALEMKRNTERYRLIQWASRAFEGLRVVPPGNGICHQINLEYLAKVVTVEDGLQGLVASFDSLVGMDSHTPMVNSLGVLGWGVGGIEAATAMLGEPIGLRVPRVVGCRLVGRLRGSASTTDLSLTVTQQLREKGVVGAFVEFFGDGARALSLPQRATLSNMAPEYGASVGFFAVDRETLRYFRLTGRDAGHIALVEAYARAQGVWAAENTPDPLFDDVLEIDVSAVEPSAAGPRRPQDRVPLSGVPATFRTLVPNADADAVERPRDGDVVIAAITSCTNTSNPSVMIEAGLLARAAVARGLRTPPWVKTSLAPGSRVVADYLRAAGLQGALDALGFGVIGFGCTTCMGNSGPLAPGVADHVGDGRTVCAVLSGNRNFEGRVHNLAKANYLVSPALVVAYALAGSVLVDLTREPLGPDADGKPVFLTDLLPSRDEVEALIRLHVQPKPFIARYGGGFAVPDGWDRLDGGTGDVFNWSAGSTFIRRPPFLDDGQTSIAGDIRGARALAILGDSVTTDHISPVSQIPSTSSAGRYLLGLGVPQGEFGSYMARRANHDVMIRGTFANPRLVNEMVPGEPGGRTRYATNGAVIDIDEAARRYAAEGVPLVVIAGRDYGAGSSRDWAAKGTRLLGVRAVIGESFERIHRSNLVGMGIAPLQFPPGIDRKTLRLSGSEVFDVTGLGDDLQPLQTVCLTVRRADGSHERVDLTCRIDTDRELAWYRSGGILPLAIEGLADRRAA